MPALQIFGQITKSPVNTGCDLVAYSGFSASNYLSQPYNADLDFGTGDFYVCGWVKDSSYTTYKRAIVRQNPSGTAHGTGANYSVSTDNTGKLEFVIGTGGTSITKITTASAVPTNTWVHFCAVRSSGLMYLYIDGRSSNTPVSNTVSVDNTSATLFVCSGKYDDSFQPSIENNALLRIGAGAPTAEQIAKIYEDEKVLFQSGSQATLYGSSDAVTALAYDEDESILRVGTSSGRSDFSGLRRVSNTTTGVTTAISSSNGMVVEQ